MNSAYWLNTAWYWQCRHEGRAFRRSFNRVRQTQSSILRAILRRNVRSIYGTTYGFDRIRSIEDFQHRVPISDYESLAGHVERIANGEAHILTHERVTLLEPTSGSTSAEKLIPYTAGLQREFHRAVSAWVWDVMRHIPTVRRGRAFWSISPPRLENRKTAAGIPVGFDDDVQYLSSMQRLLVSPLLVVPPEIQRVRHFEQFRYAMLCYLIRASDVALISVWSPTFLTALLDRFEEWSDAICSDLRAGTVRPPGTVPETGSIELQMQPAPERADFLSRLLRGPGAMGEKLAECWPQLSLISCWADASAAHHLPRLREYFPEVAIQPKGLIATEGVVSLPLCGVDGAALALRSHFFEFEKVRADGPAGTDGVRCLLADQLEQGKRYRVFITTSGGLYRYVLGDVVDVVGFQQQCPLLRFVGRSGCVSDLVGEKLNEAHVRTVLDRLFDQFGLRPQFAMLAPSDGQPPKYRLYLAGAEIAVDSELQDSLGLRKEQLVVQASRLHSTAEICQRQTPQTPKSFSLRSLAGELQTHLEENPHYRYAVGFGQLGPAEVCLLRLDAREAWNCYERQCLRRGQRPGDIKPAALDRSTGWEGTFSAIRNSGNLQQDNHHGRP